MAHKFRTATGGKGLPPAAAAAAADPAPEPDSDAEPDAESDADLPVEDDPEEQEEEQEQDDDDDGGPAKRARVDDGDDNPRLLDDDLRSSDDDGDFPRAPAFAGAGGDDDDSEEEEEDEEHPAFARVPGPELCDFGDATDFGRLYAKGSFVNIPREVLVELAKMALAGHVMDQTKDKQFKLTHSAAVMNGARAGERLEAVGERVIKGMLTVAAMHAEATGDERPQATLKRLVEMAKKDEFVLEAATATTKPPFRCTFLHKSDPRATERAGAVVVVARNATTSSETARPREFRFCAGAAFVPAVRGVRACVKFHEMFARQVHALYKAHRAHVDAAAPAAYRKNAAFEVDLLRAAGALVQAFDNAFWLVAGIVPRH